MIYYSTPQERPFLVNMAKNPAVTRHLPIRTRISVAVLGIVTDHVRRSDGTINRSLLNFLARRTPPKSRPVRGVRTTDISINPSVTLRLFVPSTGANLPVIVFFHGGGFAFLSADNSHYDAVCRRIARKTNTIVVSVDYRLSPEHRHPAAYDDGIAALHFLDNDGLAAADPAAASAADLSSCFLVGDSAGGNICHNVASRWAAETNWNRVRVEGVVAIQPWFGGEERTEAEVRLKGAPVVSVERTDWLWRAFLPDGADRDHEAANVFGPRAVALPAGFPPVVVVVGGYDPLQDWQRRYYEGLRERGVEARLVEFPDSIHAFYVFPELPDSRKLVDVVKEFIESRRTPATAAGS